TTPPVPAGQAAGQTATLNGTVSITIGGVPATVLFAGIAAGSAGVYQFNVQLPAGLAAGDLPVVIQYNGVQSSQTAYLRVL
ncbi:MAG: hypothetical protein JWO80_6195, partial [Bryobacterales bacterium]|nr:hypothetical protein [Bryobacterales bacterium]